MKSTKKICIGPLKTTCKYFFLRANPVFAFSNMALFHRAVKPQALKSKKDPRRGERPIRGQFWLQMECVECLECVTSLVTKVKQRVFYIKHICTYCIVLDTKVFYIKHLCQYCIVLLINFVFNQL